MRGPAEARPGQFLVMPYCASGSLQVQLLGDGTGLKSYEDRLRIARGLATGLSHLHAKRIFHRDVKPDNVLLTAKLEPRLADFGGSKAIEAGGAAEMATSYATVHHVGTAGYAAPEVQFGKFGPKTDIFASGVVLLQLATGKPAVMVDRRGAPVPLRDHLMTMLQGPAALTSDSDPDAAFSAFAQAQADARCAWPPRAIAGLLQLGLRCTEPEAHARPPAVEVERVLDDLLKADGGVSGFGSRPDLLASEAALTCTLCEEAQRDCVLLPCNHAVGCGPCTARLDRCPLCRAAKEGVREVEGPVLRTWQGPAGGGARLRGWMLPQPAAAFAATAAAAPAIDDAELAEMRAALLFKRQREAKEAEEAAERRGWAVEAAKRYEARRPVIAAWWAKQHEAARSTGSPGWVFPPDVFDVTVAPGEDVQAAVDGCPRGGSVLLLPGTHEGPLVLAAGKEVRVFGQGEATLYTIGGTPLTSHGGDNVMVDGLILRSEVGTSGGYGVLFKGSKMRLQACDSSSMTDACIKIMTGSDPVVASCK